MRAGQWILFIGIIFGVSMSANAQQVSAPSGWSDNIDGAMRILKKGTSRIEIGPWESFHGASIEHWLDTRKSEMPTGVQLVSSKEIKKETSGRTEYFYVNQRTKINGKGGSGTVIACPGVEGTARLLRMDVENTKFGDAISGGKFMDRVCAEEPKGAPIQRPGPSNRTVAKNGSRDTPPSPQPNSTSLQTGSPSEVMTDTLPPIKTLEGLVEVRGMITYGIQAGGMYGTTEDFIALFDDGTYSSDLPRTFGVSKAESKAKRPNYWGQWRKRGGELELKGTGDKKFDTTLGDWLAVPGGRDHRLSGCYGRLTSTSGADYLSGTTVGLARTWCFYPSGRFTNNSTAFGSSSNPGVSMRASDKARGRYRIDGNMAHFVYDDGHEVMAVFAYINEDRTHIMLNGSRFMGNKKR